MSMTFPNETPEHRAARNQLLEAEVKLRRAMEAVAEARRAMPPGGAVPQDYVFDGLDAAGQPARIRLSELFAEGKDSLIVYNFMFPRYSGDDRPKPSAGRDGEAAARARPLPVMYGAARPARRRRRPSRGGRRQFAVVAKAPLDRLVTFGRERGWKHIRLLSSAGNRFKRDYHAENESGEQMPMVTVFHRQPDGIRHFWSSEMFDEPVEPGQDPRHAGLLEPLWNMMDLTREGRPKWDEQIQYECCNGEKAADRAA